MGIFCMTQGTQTGALGNPLQHSCLGNPMDRGAWRATVLRVKNSWTGLKLLGNNNKLP